MLQPLLQAFAALGTSLADEMSIRGIIQQNGLIPLVYQVISGDISLYGSLTYYIIYLYIYVLYSFFGLQSLHYVLLPCIFGAFEHISGIVIKIRNSEHVQYFRAIRSKKTWPQFRAQICAIERK